jgi:hypothetical protein
VALVELATFHDRLTAELVRSHLASEGIGSVLFDEGLSSLGLGGWAPVRLMVDEDDLPLARRVLSETDGDGSG